jgi:hypothetical protein
VLHEHLLGFALSPSPPPLLPSVQACQLWVHILWLIEFEMRSASLRLPLVSKNAGLFVFVTPSKDEYCPLLEAHPGDFAVPGSSRMRMGENEDISLHGGDCALLGFLNRTQLSPHERRAVHLPVVRS